MDITIWYSRSTGLRELEALFRDICAKVDLSRAFAWTEPMPDDATQEHVFGDDGLFAYLRRSDISDFRLNFYRDLNTDCFIIAIVNQELTYIDIRLDRPSQDAVLELAKEQLGEWDRIKYGREVVGSRPARYPPPMPAGAGQADAHGQLDADASPSDGSGELDLSVPVPPTPLKADGEQYLVYEVHMRNLTQETVWLHRLDVIEAGLGTMAVFAGDDLTSMVGFRGPVLRPGKTREFVFEPDVLATAFLWLPTASRRVRQLQHRVVFSTGPSAAPQDARVIVGGNLVPETEAPLVLGPPVCGGTWLIDNCHHRDGGLYPIDGKLCMAQRYAMDLMGLGPDRRIACGDPRRFPNWYGYGADLVAAADSIVARTHDHATELGAGNFVVLDVGQGNFATYVHLQEGTICVREGERVARGQVIGRLGNSGGDDMPPHLHYHVMKMDSPLPADTRAAFCGEGIPWVLDSFELLGYSECALAHQVMLPHETSRPRSGESGVRRYHEYPLHTAVITV